MNVLSTQIDVNGGEIPSEFNLGLVLGLVIPLAMLLIGGLAYFICASMDSNPVPVEASYVQVSRNRDHSSLTYELKEQLWFNWNNLINLIIYNIRLSWLFLKPSHNIIKFHLLSHSPSSRSFDQHAFQIIRQIHFKFTPVSFHIVIN